MPGPVQRELHRVRRLTTLAVGVRAAGDALLCVGLGIGTVAIAVRLAGRAVTPSPSWLLALVPVAAWIAWRVVRERPAPELCAAHLDRRYALGGLLLASGERATEAWAPDLARRLAAVPADRRPRLHPWRGLGRAGLGVAFALAVGAVPAPDPVGRGGAPPALGTAVADLLEKVEAAADAAVLPPGGAEELRERVRELEERLSDGRAVDWSDVDAVEERLAHEQGLQAGGIAGVRAAARALARDEERSGEMPDPDALAQMAELAQRAQELGLDADLPPELRDAIERLARAGAEAADGGAIDPAALGLDPEQLKRLAESLEGAAGKRLAHAAERLAPDQLGELRDLLENGGFGGGGPGGTRDAQGGDGFDPNPGPDGDGAPGRGGINRGRGDAALHGTHTMDVDTEALRGEKLPPGAAIPQSWQRMGLGRAEPEVAPERAPASGGGPVGESAGAAAWRRRLSPHQQEVVQRFFSADPDGPR